MTGQNIYTNVTTSKINMKLLYDKTPNNTQPSCAAPARCTAVSLAISNNGNRKVL